MREFCGKFMRPPGDRLFSCGAGHGACVDAYGVVQACLPLRAPQTTVSLREAGDGEAVGSGGGREGGPSGGREGGRGGEPPRAARHAARAPSTPPACATP